MKKFLCFSLIVALLISLCACSFEKEEDEKDEKDKSDRQSMSQLFGMGEETTEETDAKEPTTEAVETQAPTTAPEVTVPATTEAVNAIILNTYAITLNAGQTFQLTATAENQNTLRWKSSNDAVAVVNSKGMVTAATAGVANITCYDDNAIEAACTVLVVDSNMTTQTPQTITANFIFPHSSSTYLNPEEVYVRLNSLAGYPMASSFAQDAINEIYARNGYVFQSPELAAYYLAQSWYVPDVTFNLGNLNKYETANVALLQNYK